MKLDKLRKIAEEIGTEFAEATTACNVYYFFENKWRKLDDSDEVPPDFVECLSAAEDEPVAHYVSKSKLAWFACSSMGCSISVEFATSPNIATRQSTRNRLEQVLTRASNAYQVAHHPLTLLLSKDAFKHELQNAIEAFSGASSKSDSTEGLSQQELLAVFAFDIDHFKQINDSHGHLYGDQVLKAFAMRLESASESWLQSDVGDTKILLAHPSGEEFLAMVVGSVTRDQLIELGSLLRGKIADELIPSEREWAWLQSNGNISGLLPPPLEERKVTTSIGMVLYTPTSSSSSAKDRVSMLLDQADTALYRAKAGGRNQLIAFDEILENCGRVLEHDSNTRIIAIDIGKNVGVVEGQEFLVFPPGFTGKRKYEISDGRSKRTIGFYPRFSVTRITVFDVQPELSFAFISDSDDASLTIEVNSHLEAIPLGSIGHLLPHAAKYLSKNMQGVKVGDIEAVKKYVSDNQHLAAKPYAVVFRYTKADTYLKRYGSAGLNAALARLYRDVVAAFHTSGSVGILDSMSVAMVGSGPDYDNSRVSDFVQRLRADMTELGLVAGVFHTKGVPPAEVKKEKLDAHHAIEFARFAASDHAIENQGLVTRFSIATARRILRSQRDAALYTSAQADFQKLKSLGMKDPYLANVAGLMWSEQKKYDEAADLFEEAAALDPQNYIYKTNFITAARTQDRMERALRLLAALSDEEVRPIVDSHAYGFFAYAGVLAIAFHQGLPEANVDRLRWMGPLALALKINGKAETKEVIRSAMIKLA